MYHGSKIEELVTQGLTLDACYSGWDACRLAIKQVGSKAWCLMLAAWYFKPGSGARPDEGRLLMPQLMTWSNIPRGNFLMFTITNIFNWLVPTSSTVFTLIALSRGWTCPLSRLRCNRTCPLPAVTCCLVHHWYGEPNNKIVRSFNNIIFGPCFTGWHPVFNWRRQPAYSIDPS